ncbi:hypothetical protein TVAG_157420 [Trichomonas vaginalis G3]|uniref:Uncharacterized protein n=1 Tax=Trichomonas vaginalis (strain ATCC PRA-98 / G3) TaxID=412133 RepID=A2E9L4_TRIV3|nr:hypothetical protein TVAGG3_0746340 [Trichomonas vaginalis G3]EAY10665.1 hypothetical protein TVAG_157420 [Trichomonas vaginalis G3]KAI5512193.1 hypothetical protein TVAGG3_0746340 [Trichomonas vaginalis G3]|eukprot:XP_001322888.1 hypothetical protein [Trichomonas vaginalis G3]
MLYRCCFCCCKGVYDASISFYYKHEKKNKVNPAHRMKCAGICCGFELCNMLCDCRTKAHRKASHRPGSHNYKNDKMDELELIFWLIFFAIYALVYIFFFISFIWAFILMLNGPASDAEEDFEDNLTDRAIEYYNTHQDRSSDFDKDEENPARV